MRQVVHMFAASVFLILGSGGKPIDRSEKLLSFGDFHRRIWAGEVNLADDRLWHGPLGTARMEYAASKT
jgi:hypothetical protein